MITKYNILGFYTSIASRQWNRSTEAGSASYEIFRVFLETNKVPALQFIVAASTTANLYLLDSNDDVVGSAMAMTVEADSDPDLTYKRLIFLGSTLSGNSDGDYSLKLVNGSDTYYSDVFGWTSDADYLSDLVKVSAVSSDIRSGNGYILNLDSFTFECYLNADYLWIEPAIEEQAYDKKGISVPLYGDLTKTREFNVYACEYIYEFLLGLRILECNGTITITWNGVSYTASDILVEKTDDHATDSMQVKLSFIDKNETLGVYNQV